MIDSTWLGQKPRSTRDKTQVKNPMDFFEKKIGQNNAALIIF
jgi:hypothetical protein